jgi:hypothetical protein
MNSKSGTQIRMIIATQAFGGRAHRHNRALTGLKLPERRKEVAAGGDLLPLVLLAALFRNPLSSR